MMKGSDMNAIQALALVARSTFRPMDSYDREAFAGTESPNALIHYADQFCELYTIVLDNNRICLIDAEGDEQHFVLGENIFA
jgi:hypothetical protein